MSDATDLPFSKEKQVRRVWTCRANNDGCTYKTPCRSCLGRRNRRKGQKAQRMARKITGIPKAAFHGQLGNEENYRDPHFRWECKAGAQAGPVGTRFLASEKQADQNKAIGDMRYFAAQFVPSGWGGDCIVAMRGTVFNKYIRPALDAYYGTPEAS
jgi:hypothetical protein